MIDPAVCVLTIRVFLLQHLLRNSKLEALVVQWIKSKEQVMSIYGIQNMCP